MNVAGARSSGALPEFREGWSRVAPTTSLRPADATAGIEKGHVSGCAAKEELRSGTDPWFGINSIPSPSEPQRLELRMNQ
jgi:hypothetical protein